MLSPRWSKIWRELWANRARTLLVVLSLAVGVTAVGMIAGTYTVVTRDLPAAYDQVNPASARLVTDPFDEGMVRVVQGMPGVAQAEGRRTVVMRMQVGPDEWRDIDVFAIADYDDMHINKIWPERGAWPPEERQILIERAALGQTGAGIGQKLLLEAPNGVQRELTIAGLTHDLNLPSANFVNRAYGYVTFDTLAWFGLEDDFNELSIVVSSDPDDRRHITQLASEVRSKVSKGGRSVYWVTVPEPGKHPFEQFITPMAFLLSVLGLLSLLLSGFLVINTISALLAQQIRQIGVMKAVGGRTRQIMAMYLGMVLLLGIMAFLLAVPLGLVAGRMVSGLVAQLINFDIASYRVPAWVFVLQAAAALLLPLLASLVPIVAGTRVTVREAISSYGLAEGQEGGGWLDQLLAYVRGLPRPLLLSLRNTFRRKARLLLTLITLALGTTIFVAVFSVRASLLLTLEDALQYWQYDVGITFSRPYRIEEIEQLALQVPGVAGAESWGYHSTRRLREDDSNSDNLILIAPPATTELLEPTVLGGRWLLAEDENAVVINTDLLRQEPDIRVGQEIVLDLDGRQSTWLVVGLIRGVLSGPTLYANYPYVSRVVRDVDRASSVQVVSENHAPAFQQQVAQDLEERFESSGLRVASTATIAQLRRVAVTQFNVILIFLLVMALLLALVGALGLAGTMSINVLERTREIGVMRAIGASGRSVQNMVMVEGGLIALMSWLLGTLLALPVSRLLSDAVGASFLRAPLSFTFSLGGAAFWLLAVILLAAAASLWPAHRAARLTVREVLAYE